MVERPTPGPHGPGSRNEALTARRAARRRQIRRRRLLALLAVVATIAAIAAVLTLGGGGSDSKGKGEMPNGSQRTASEQRGSAAGESGGRVRNSTPQPNWEPHTGPVPILEYHVLGDAPGDAPYPELYVPRPDFRHQLEWLDRSGYQAVTLEQVEQAWFDGGTLPPTPVVLSFDDGYRPQYTFALPQLRKHGWAGLLNLKAEGSDLYESDVREMVAAGWELAAHTIHHLDLTELDAAALREEVAGARAILRRDYGVPVRNFCYPAGAFDETAIAAVRAAGYVGATTEIPGYADRDAPYELARFEILGSTGVSGLAADLASG